MLFFPIDTLKTRFQAEGGFIQNGGFKKIYNGLGPSLVASGFSTSVFFLSYSFFKKKFENDFLLTANSFISAGISEFLGCLIKIPGEIVKQKLQSGKYGPNGERNFFTIFFSGFQSEHIIENVKYFNRIFLITLFREIPFSAVQFTLYDKFKSFLLEKNEKKNSRERIGLISGLLSGSISGFITTPLDFIKTRIVLCDNQMSILYCVKTVVKNEGLLSFFKGAVPRTLWIGLGGSFFFGYYEYVFSLMEKKVHIKFL